MGAPYGGFYSPLLSGGCAENPPFPRTPRTFGISSAGERACERAYERPRVRRMCRFYGGSGDFLSNYM